MAEKKKSFDFFEEKIDTTKKDVEPEVKCIDCCGMVPISQTKKWMGMPFCVSCYRKLARQEKGEAEAAKYKDLEQRIQQLQQNLQQHIQQSPLPASADLTSVLAAIIQFGTTSALPEYNYIARILQAPGRNAAFQRAKILDALNMVLDLFRVIKK